MKQYKSSQRLRAPPPDPIAAGGCNYRSNLLYCTFFSPGLRMVEDDAIGAGSLDSITASVKSRTLQSVITSVPPGQRVLVPVSLSYNYPSFCSSCKISILRISGWLWVVAGGCSRMTQPAHNPMVFIPSQFVLSSDTSMVPFSQPSWTAGW